MHGRQLAMAEHSGWKGGGPRESGLVMIKAGKMGRRGRLIEEYRRAVWP
jgi:hypothetical protein